MAYTMSASCQDECLYTMNQRQDGPLVVLQIIPRLKIGGAERAVIDISRALTAAGNHSLVVSQGGELVPVLLHTRATHVEMPVASKFPLTIAANALRLARLIRREGVNVVHVRSRAPAWSALIAARRTGTPIITTFHAPYNFSSRAKKLYNSVMARGDRVIAISGFVARHVRDEYGVADSRLRCIFRGIDMARFDPAAVGIDRISSLAEYWNLPDGIPVIMLPGRLTRLKGHGVVIEAMKRLEHDAICLMVGVAGGRVALRREIEAQILDAGLEGRVTLIDSCSDMPAAYRLADVIVQPSLVPEGFGRVAVEAQAMGVPVVASETGATTETVEHGTTGWLVPPGDSGALTQALETALGLDAQARIKHAAVARARAVSNFALGDMCEATLDVYRELAGAA